MIEPEQIDIALDVLNDNAEAEALYRKMKCEHKAEEFRAKAFLNSNGPIEVRKAMAVLSPDYQLALGALAEAAKDLRLAQNDREKAKYVIEVWEQEGHNARAAERVK